MKISFKTSQQETTWNEIAAIWRLADDIDIYHGGWLFDHFYPLNTEPTEDCFEGWTIAAGLGSITKRLRLGHMVTSNTYRHPAVAANMVATLDHISNGRFDFGFGAGWHEEEHGAYGIALPQLGERFDRFDEALEVIGNRGDDPEPDRAGAQAPADPGKVRGGGGLGGGPRHPVAGRAAGPRLAPIERPAPRRIARRAGQAGADFAAIGDGVGDHRLRRPAGAGKRGDQRDP